MHRNMAVPVLLGLGLVLAGCNGNKPPNTTIVDFAQPQAAESAQGQELGSGIRIKFITAKGTHRMMQAEVQRQLESFINDGQYEIVRVVSTRCDEDQHLLSAEVYYRLKK